MQNPQLLPGLVVVDATHASLPLRYAMRGSPSPPIAIDDSVPTAAASMRRLVLLEQVTSSQ